LSPDKTKPSMKKQSIYTLVILFALGFTSCKKETEFEQPAFPVGTSYVSDNYAANTTDEQAILSQMNNLSTYMKRGQIAGTVLYLDSLNNLFQAGNESLKSICTTYYGDLIDSPNGYFSSLAEASGGTYVVGAPQGQGGVFMNRLFDEFGVEHNELIDKGLYSAALYNQALTFMTPTMTQANLDRIVCLFGANPSFPNSGSANVSSPDKFMANYAARRDKNNGTGIYTKFKNAAILAQAQIAAGSSYASEVQNSLTTMRQSWEKASAATAINYCHSTVSALSATNPTDAAIASGLHAYAEGLGFIHGWKSISQQYRIITDTQIDEILVLLNAPYNQDPNSFLFVTDAANQLPKIQEVISRLKAIYGFSTSEIEDFKKNWVAEQGR
jgi:hypothetical protein